jgi:adenosylcobinamide-GDP ribazoletransferase
MLPSFALALSFLTIFRVPLYPSRSAGPKELAASFAWFPVVGVLLGGIWALLMAVLRPQLPPLLVAVLLVLVMAVLTRGLHLDGLADLADGVGGGYTPQRRLEIMKDSRIGTFGATALLLILALKIAALSALVSAAQWQALLLTPLLSRLAMVLGAYRSIYPRPEGGLGKSFCEQLNLAQVGVALSLALVATLAIAAVLGGIMLLSMLACVGLLRLGSRRWLGGTTGDVLGALNEIAEAVLLTVAVLATSKLAGS